VVGRDGEGRSQQKYNVGNMAKIMITQRTRERRVGALVQQRTGKPLDGHATYFPQHAGIAMNLTIRLLHNRSRPWLMSSRSEMDRLPWGGDQGERETPPDLKIVALQANHVSNAACRPILHNGE